MPEPEAQALTTDRIGRGRAIMMIAAAAAAALVRDRAGRDGSRLLPSRGLCRARDVSAHSATVKLWLSQP